MQYSGESGDKKKNVGHGNRCRIVHVYIVTSQYIDLLRYNNKVVFIQYRKYRLGSMIYFADSRIYQPIDFILIAIYFLC